MSVPSAQNIAALGDLGLEVHITEMDVACTNCTASRLQTQAQIYGSMLSTCLSQPACKSFESWGFTDKHTWLGEVRAAVGGSACVWGAVCVPVVERAVVVVAGWLHSWLLSPTPVVLVQCCGADMVQDKHPLPFDENYVGKPAFYQMLAVLQA